MAKVVDQLLTEEPFLGAGVDPRDGGGADAGDKSPSTCYFHWASASPNEESLIAVPRNQMPWCQFPHSGL